MNAAIGTLIDRCMAELGYDYTTPQPSLDERESGPPTAAELAAHGYAYRIYRDPPAASFSPLDAETERALNETCGPAATQAVGLIEFNQVRQQFANAWTTFQIEADSDERSQDALQRWVNCMADAGYGDFAAPTDAEVSAGELDGGHEGEAGIALAVTDYACRDSSTYTETRRAVMAALADEWVEENPQLLADFESTKADLFERVADTVGD